MHFWHVSSACWSCMSTWEQTTSSALWCRSRAVIDATYTVTQEDGASEEASALAVARAHERMMQADLAQAQAAAEQPRQAAGAEGSGARQRTAAAGSHAASRSQAQQLQALSRAEQVPKPLTLPEKHWQAQWLHGVVILPTSR